MTFATTAARLRAALPAVLALCAAQAASAAAPSEAALQSWRATIAQTPVPQEGCFKASYPGTAWTPVQCATAPARPYVPKRGASGRLVGNGNDYSAVVTGLLSSVVGSFPSITGLKTEKGYGGKADTYSLQLNSEFFSSAACSGATDPSKCLGWQQFVYSNTGTAFMQYWLINYGNTCPSGGWMAYSGDCYRNSAAVNVPVQKLTALAGLSVSGTAVAGGTDTMVLTTSTDAYSTTGKDSVVDLASSWNAAEYNVVGDGGGSEAKFNKVTTITVNIAVKDGTTKAPACKGKDGTTGETNNLTLGKCTTSGGTTPGVQFTEAN
jgi:hypothetical protein